MTSKPTHSSELEEHAKILFDRIDRELELGVRALPEFPATAKRISDVMTNPNYRAKDLVEAIEGDSRMSNLLIKAASSSMYAAKEPCEDLGLAIRRMGANTTRNLVLMYSLATLFHSDKRPGQIRIKRIWDDCSKTSAIAMLIANQASGIKTESALLAALLQDAGSLFIITLMSDKAKTEYHWQLVDQMIKDFSTSLSVRILKHWNISEDVIECAKNKDNWMREHDGPADLADLMIMARYHAYLNSERIKECPKFTDMPCVKRLKLRKNEMTPFQGLKLINEAKDEINDIMRLLAI